MEMRTKQQTLILQPFRNTVTLLETSSKNSTSQTTVSKSILSLSSAPTDKISSLRATLTSLGTACRAIRSRGSTLMTPTTISMSLERCSLKTSLSLGSMRLLFQRRQPMTSASFLPSFAKWQQSQLGMRQNLSDRRIPQVRAYSTFLALTPGTRDLRDLPSLTVLGDARLTSTRSSTRSNLARWHVQETPAAQLSSLR